jgi:hypothetical protein
MQDTQLTKEQARASAEAILAAARHERDRKSPANAKFPELARFPNTGRFAVLNAVRRDVAQDWLGKLFNVARISLCVTAMYFLSIDHERGTEVLWLALGWLFLARGIENRRIRSKLRARAEEHQRRINRSS